MECTSDQVYANPTVATFQFQGGNSGESPRGLPGRRTFDRVRAVLWTNGTRADGWVAAATDPGAIGSGTNNAKRGPSPLPVRTDALDSVACYVGFQRVWVIPDTRRLQSARVSISCSYGHRVSDPMSSVKTSQNEKSIPLGKLRVFAAIAQSVERRFRKA